MLLLIILGLFICGNFGQVLQGPQFQQPYPIQYPQNPQYGWGWRQYPNYYQEIGQFR